MGMTTLDIFRYLLCPEDTTCGGNGDFSHSAGAAKSLFWMCAAVFAGLLLARLG